MSTEGFPIEGLRGSPLSTKTLTDMGSRCRRMPENELLCRQVLERLQFLHDSVAPLDVEDQPKVKYTGVVVRFVKLMRRKPLLQRLASSETLVMTIHELQLKLSDVGQAMGLADKPEMTKWEAQWDADRAEQYGKLTKLVTGASERMLVNEFRGDKKVKEALMNLHSGINCKGQSPEMVELKETTFNRVSTYLNQTGLRMFEWFIPIDDVEYEDEAIGDRGTFGDVSRGTWLHDGKRTEVVVKRLFPETSSDSDDAFLSQLTLWGGLPDNEHILKLYGGSHVSNPQFYVCENAHYGNLADFLDDGEHSVRFWRLFKQVALGLKFLHDRNTVHGGLKCNNILVGANYTAKLADFGFSTVRTLSAGLSGNADRANARSVRWKPKEVLEETGMDEPRFKSDVYSLAMCMIEAKTHEAPFGMDDDAEVMDMIMRGERHPCPDDMSETSTEWAFISRLCDPDIEKRPSLDEVLKEISVFADAEEKQHP
ncbi:serine/threonine protein kinase [Phytophthora nicotianae CJ01A1]|nr:serine/threonine protein kinase [Phytophthora nicotianae]ETP24251.1 serine/threonine protein kinase [Phytophthora nicotianae CJ01A1]KUF79643.1 serine/threonine-protein kinase drkD [Phytophthora nicotianae]ETL26748.1 serine/threonine protein kinase [Phytophthora nicotianae]ETL79979.1 serine/threonine protein kinase [Phytophthora nicotianae]